MEKQKAHFVRFAEEENQAIGQVAEKLNLSVTELIRRATRCGLPIVRAVEPPGVKRLEKEA